MKSENILTVKDTARYLRLSEMTVLRLTNQGMIPGVKFGRQWRYDKEKINQLIQGGNAVAQAKVERPEAVRS